MKVAANGLQIEVDIQGPPNGEPLLLVMGLGMQLTGWPEPLVADLARRGYRVVRFDNRDIGLSQHLDHLGLPHVGWASLKHVLHLPVRSPYTLADMARRVDIARFTAAHVDGFTPPEAAARQIHGPCRHPALSGKPAPRRQHHRPRSHHSPPSHSPDSRAVDSEWLLKAGDGESVRASELQLDRLVAGGAAFALVGGAQSGRHGQDEVVGD